jgi:hypothetical protein
VGRLLLTRKVDQGLRLTIRPEHVAELGDLIRNGITVTISEVTREGKVRLSIEAPDSVLILRDELELMI